MSRVGSGNHGSSRVASAALFGILWRALAEVLGTAATATLLRRACKRAGARHRQIDELAIVRTGLTYTYTVPEAWSADGDEPPEAMRVLLEELRPLLVELTGPLLVQRLERIAEFQERGLTVPQEGPK